MVCLKNKIFDTGNLPSLVGNFFFKSLLQSLVEEAILICFIFAVFLHELKSLKFLVQNVPVFSLMTVRVHLIGLVLVSYIYIILCYFFYLLGFAIYPWCTAFPISVPVQYLPNFYPSLLQL